MNSNEYNEGWRSYHQNGGALINPYPSGTPAANDFERGWAQALRRRPDSEFAGSTNSEFFKIMREQNAPKPPAAPPAPNPYARAKGGG